MQAYFDGTTTREIPVFERPPGSFDQYLQGPLLMVEQQTTTVVPAGWQVSSRSDGSLLLERTA